MKERSADDDVRDDNVKVCVRFNLVNASFRANDLHYSTLHRTDALVVNEKDCQLCRLPSHSTVKQFQTLRQSLLGVFHCNFLDY